MPSTTMPRPASENTFQVAFKIPEEWRDLADEIAAAMSTPGITTTRTDALRSALYLGLQELRVKHVAPPAAPSRPRKR
jgi:hypothetical protein